jgi:hypothetical protein
VTEREPPANHMRQHRITPADINRINRDFWAAQEAPREGPSVHPGIPALVREAHLIEIRAIQETHDKQRTQQTIAATRERRDKGDATRDAVYLSAQKIVERRGSMSRTALSDLVADDIGNISAEHVLRILKQHANDKKGRSNEALLPAKKAVRKSTHRTSRSAITC